MCYEVELEEREEEVGVAEEGEEENEDEEQEDEGVEEQEEEEEEEEPQDEVVEQLQEEEEQEDEEEQSHAGNNIPILLKLIISPSKSLASHSRHTAAQSQYTSRLQRNSNPRHRHLSAVTINSRGRCSSPCTAAPSRAHLPPRPPAILFTLRPQPHSSTP